MICAGFDVGTKFIKIVITRDDKIIGFDIRELNGTFAQVLKASYKAALSMARVFSMQVRARGATGFGSNLVKRADFVFDDEMCAARAVAHLSPEIRTVIDAGALFIHLCTVSRTGLVLDTIENEKCAAGSGKFLEMIATSLNVPLERISHVAQSSKDPYHMSNSCAVFAESEVISRMNMGAAPEDILAGILVSIAQKAGTMFSMTHCAGPLALVGGLAKVPYFVNALEETLGIEVQTVTLDPQLAGAYGAALWAARRK